MTVTVTHEGEPRMSRGGFEGEPRATRGGFARRLRAWRRRPRVQVVVSARRGRAAWWFIATAVYRAGAVPIRVTARTRAPGPGDALILSGGADIAESASYSYGDVDARLRDDRLEPDRDDLELGLLDHAARRDLPVLGICRGAQLMNVYGGGSLILHVNPPAPWTALPCKTITTAPSSRLAGLLGRRRCRVNSMHRNAIDRVAADLQVSARDDRGVVQGVEAPDRRFWIGVQWHPEYLLTRLEQQRLFRGLVAAARARAARPARARGHAGAAGGPAS